jgi:hypothetical protein
MMQIDNQTVLFTNESSKAVTFSAAFAGDPAVSALAVNNNAEVFVSNLTTGGCTLNTSAPITGQVLVVAVRG